MNKLYKWLIISFLLPLPTFATHIVGGEFFLIDRRTNDFRFTLGLNLYFDDINGNPQAEDASIDVSIFRKSDNLRISDLSIPRISNSFISYNSPTCTVGNLRTRRLVYSIDILLSPNTFSSSQGYYVVWERCCRNVTISNIQTPGAVGNAFYMEFPPVVDSFGSRIFNSSSQFPLVQGDYACANTPFRFPFGATDPDGDELIYSLATPLAGRSGNGSNGNPGPKPTQGSPAPYPFVQWASGFGLNNIIPGPEPVRVNSRTGEISFTANRTDLYVFSVICEEYRNGRKIGEVRRDFQIAVLDCPINLQPAVAMKQNNVRIARNSVIKVKATDSRCFDILLNDQFPTGTVNPSSQLSVRIAKSNAPAGLVSLTPSTGTVRANNDTLRSKLCWANCAQNPTGLPFDLQLVVEDQGCPFPRTDTIRVLFDFDPKPNIPSVESTDLPGNQATIIAGNSLSFNVFGTNKDLDSVSIDGIGRGFSLASANMSFSNILTTQDNIKIPFQWKPDCSLKPGTIYTIDFVLKERLCGKITIDTVTTKLTFLARPSRPPEIVTTLPGNTVEKLIGETIAFDVIATDPDGDVMSVKAVGKGFQLSAVGIEYESPKSGQAKLTIPFLWKIPCDALGIVPDNKFVIDFITEDNSCQPNRFDTTQVTLIIKDIKAEYTFLPVNMFTPNPEVDSLNTYFTIPDLPADNCEDRFDKIEIYNRWGKLVYKSADRNFKWAGKNFPTGDYYYLIYYEKRRWKGWIYLVR